MTRARPGRARPSRARPRAARRLLGALGLAALAAAAFPSAPLHAQFFAFGQNKIQYRDFEWRVVRGAHVDLYHYPAEEHLAPVALAYAEASYDTLALQFGHEVPTRVPLVMYASHVDFEQTNILPFTPPEGLLGVTDFLKRRVTLPFRGNLAEFRHTLRHEMVHVFQISLMAQAYDEAPRGARPQLPLWWTEGLAELWSAGEDARDEMILRDLTLTGRMPTLRQLAFASGGAVYPIGGRIHRWLADTYGDWRVAMLYRELNRYRSFEHALAAIYGRTIDQLNDEFQLALRRQYYPVAETRAPLSVLAREVARLAIKPAPIGDSSDGLGQTYYLSPVTGYLTVYRRTVDSGRAETVVASGRSVELESFHPFESRMDARRAGFLLFSARYQDRDAVVIWDVERRRVAGRYQFPGIVSILSPAWTPGYQSIVFSGLAESGVSNLYRLTLADGSLVALTNDPYQDLDPSPSPDGRKLVFASDRTAGGDEGAMNLFALDLASGAVSQLTSGPWVDEGPIWHEDGRIYYTSSRDRVLNVFSVDSLGYSRRETSAWTGAFDAAPMSGGKGMLVSGFNNMSWNVYYYPADSAARAETFPPADSVPPAAWAWAPDTVSDSVVLARAEDQQPYRRKFTLDFAAGDVVVVPGYGGAQGAAFLASDLLGDHLLFGSVASFQSRELGGILQNLNVTGIYLNRKKRVNWGAGFFRAAGRSYEGELTVSYEEESYGVLGLVRYPFSRFSRLEGSLIIERSDRTDFTLPVDEPRRVGWIASNLVSYVHDNSLWISSGPIDGLRVAVTAGVSSDFSNGRFDGYLGGLDVRRYFRLAGQVSYAVRGFGYWAGGDRPRRVNIGGTLGLRGYPMFGYILGTRAWMANQEFRFPMLEHITLGLPFGDLRFPDVQGALFFDAGRAWLERGSDRAMLGSYGLSFRMALAPLAVLRLDWGRRFSDNDFRGYNLSERRRRPGFVHFFFGYNY